MRLSNYHDQNTKETTLSQHKPLSSGYDETMEESQMSYVQACPFKEMAESMTEIVAQTVCLQKDLAWMILELKICKKKKQWKWESYDRITTWKRSKQLNSKLKWCHRFWTNNMRFLHLNRQQMTAKQRRVMQPAILMSI